MKLPLDLVLAFYWGVREALNDIVTESGPWVYEEPALQWMYDRGVSLGDAIHRQCVRLGVIRYRYDY